jgi:uncharacterized membrane protein (DUF2068 family)
MATSTPPIEEKRPVGVTILAVLQVIAGLLGLCIPGLVFIGSALVELLGPVGTFVGTVGILIGVLLIVGPVLHFAVAVGAWYLKKWAWWLGVIATGVDVLGAVLNIWNGTGLVQAVFSVAFSLLVFIYLLTPGVRKAFRI